MKIYRKGLTLAVCLLLMFCFSIQAFAAVRVDPKKESGLSIQFSYEETMISGATFHLYYLATVNSGAHYSLAEPFDRYSIQVENQTADGWKNLAQTLKGYVATDELQPDYTGSTDEAGMISFENLKPGLYFVTGEKISYAGYTYLIAPTIVALPNLVNNTWEYNTTISPKSTRNPIPMTEVRVSKAWNDKGMESKRPENITVTLNKDGKVYESVRLNKANNWRYVWKDLPKLDNAGQPIEWSVSESPVQNYKVAVQRTDNTFVIENTYNGSQPPKPTPTPKPVIPYTGQLWWPVLICGLPGLCLLVIGIAVTKKKNHE